jgi:hypothetical protein
LEQVHEQVFITIERRQSRFEPTLSYTGSLFTALRWCKVRSSQRPDNRRKVMQIARGRTVMLTAAYGASMDSRKSFLSVGGFVASAADWEDFDGKWRDRLGREGLSCFHMADFTRSVGDFAPLKKEKQRKRGLLKDLLGIISSHAYRKFGVTVEVEALDAELADQAKLEYAPNALALAGGVACGQAIFWAREEGFPVPEFVFEDGDLAGEKLGEQVKVLTGVMPTFKSKTDSREVKAFTPLQAAEILAYEMSLLRKGSPRPTLSPPFHELDRMPGGILTPRRRHRIHPSS